MATRNALGKQATLQPKSHTGYGCTREVLHALDPGAESSAIVAYETDSETEDRQGKRDDMQITNKVDNLALQNISGLDRDAITREISTTLERYKSGEESPSQVSLRLKFLVEQLHNHSQGSKSGQQVTWVCDSLVPHVLSTDKSTILKTKCLAVRNIENWSKIMSTWLMHWAIYIDEKSHVDQSDFPMFYDNIVIDYKPKSVSLVLREVKPPVAELKTSRQKAKEYTPAKQARLNDIKSRTFKENENLKDAEQEREKRFVEDVQLRVFKEEAANYACLLKNTQSDVLNDKILEYRMKLQAHEEKQAAEYRKEQERKAREAQEERERARIAEENRLAREKARIQEQQRIEDAKRQEAARLAEAKKNEERRLAEAREQNERQKREQEEHRRAVAKKEQEAAANASSSQQALPQQNTAPLPTPSTAQSTLPPTSVQYGRKTFEADRALFSKILKNLDRVEERMNKEEAAYAKQLAPLRRKLNMLGRLTSEMDQINLVRDAIISALQDVTKIPGPSERAADFQRDALVEGNSEPVPLGFIWVVDHLARNAVTILEQESSIKSELANPIGIVITAVLSREIFQVGGKSFIEIVVARLWEKCPILQGVMGPEETEEQKLAHGWARNGTEWETAENHINRMVSYCSGFAAIAGRYFGHATRPSPYPMHNLWFLLAHMCQNAEALGDTHFYAIKGILSTAGNNLRRQYGHQADKLGRLLLVDVCNVGLSKRLSGAFACYALRQDIMQLKRYPD